MTPDLNIYHAASVIIEQYGEDARVHAAMRADERREAGDSNGYAAFKRVLRVIEEIQRTAPKSGEAVH